jgi:hypothetical protein
MTSLLTISAEQQQIIDAIASNCNVIVEAVAGSGKTTSVLHLTRAFPDFKILLLTYNSSLKLETRERVKNLGFNNIEVHSYHSFCVKYYDERAYTDKKIKEILQDNKSPNKKFFYNIIICDEAQDITDCLFELVIKIIKDMHISSSISTTSNIKKPLICVLGDRKQSIYSFRNADPRYITLANEVFKVNNNEWNTVKLSTSYRLSTPIAKFVNSMFPNNEISIKTPLKEGEPDPKPKYYICDTFNPSYIQNEIINLMDKGYKPEDFFILAASIKSHNSPCKILENYLKILKIKNREIPIYVPCNDDEKLDKDVLKGKLVICSFHQSKGLERPIVIIYGFDESYFYFYKQKQKQNQNNVAMNLLDCPNEIYVATTRAKKHLILIQHHQHKMFKFLHSGLDRNYRTSLEKICDIMEVNIYKPKEFQERETRLYKVNDFIRNMDSLLLNDLINLVFIKTVKKASTKIPIISKITTRNGLQEQVSDINGTAIPAYYENITTGKMSILENLRKIDQNNKKSNSTSSSELSKLCSNQQYDILNIENKKITKEQLLYCANIWNAYVSQYLFKTIQITQYDWLSDEYLEYGVQNIKSLNISNLANYEKSVEKTFTKGPIQITIKGCLDCIDNNNIYEFKCVDSITETNILQLIVYAFIYETKLLIDKKHNQTPFSNDSNDSSNDSSNNKKNDIDIESFEEEYENCYEYDNDNIVKKLNHDIEKKKKAINTKIKKDTTKQKYIEEIKQIEMEIKNRKKELFTQDMFKYTTGTQLRMNYFLYNILTNELLELKTNLETLQLIINKILASKMDEKIPLKDMEFIKKTLDIRNKYF